MMSMGPLGMIGSAAGAPLTQANSDKDRRATDATNESNVSQTQAENAAGIGAAEQQSESSERDADGRRMWEGNPQEDDEQKETNEDDSLVEKTNQPVSKDPSGHRGSQLDVSG